MMLGGRENQGGYTTKLSTVKTSPKFSFGGRPERNAKALTPGPGAYTQELPEKDKYRQSPSHAFGTSPRLQKNRSAVPGPGEYEPHDPRQGVSPASAFGTASRSADFSSSGRAADFAQSSRSVNPGPGRYEQSGPKTMGQEGPKHVIGVRREVKTSKDTPGPGAYAADTAITGIQRAPQSPQWGFGTAERGPLKGPRSTSPNPGPGHYDREAGSQKGPMFSMGSPKRPGRDKDTPGPGAYEANHTSFGY